MHAAESMGDPPSQAKTLSTAAAVVEATASAANQAQNEVKAALARGEPPGDLTARHASAESALLRHKAALIALLIESRAPAFYYQDREGRPMVAAASLSAQPTSTRDMRAEAAVSRPLTQLMEYLGTPTRYHAAHLVAHRFGGDPGRRNLVPLEARANTSYMKVAENKVASAFAVNPAANLYGVALARYDDPPSDISAPFEARSPNPRSRYGEKVGFSFMDLRRVPDEIDYRVVDLESGEMVVNENFFPGGPLLEYLGATRVQIQQREPELAVQLMTSEGRRLLIAELKRRSPGSR